MTKFLLISSVYTLDFIKQIRTELYSRNYDSQINLPDISIDSESNRHLLLNELDKFQGVICFLDYSDPEMHGRSAIINYYRNATRELGKYFAIYLLNNPLHGEIINDPDTVDGSELSENQIANNIAETYKSLVLFQLSSSRLVLTDENKQKIGSYIKDAIDDLKDRELYESKMATISLFFSISILIVGTLISIIGIDYIIQGTTELFSYSIILKLLQKILVLSVTGIISKILFNLYNSKRHLVDTLMNRIHAINYGDLYIKVFEGKIDREEFSKIFKDWSVNISASDNADSFPNYDLSSLKDLIEGLLKKNESKS
ncbi:hypothetical protein [Leptospira alstonii]|uniref:Uncharacterized protein n=2 Tax=Leptospira alstonii TaxID=28452 RepID=M6CP01_9LEPT|nr:hypothetical protein [Leptospira alstonii]EMJ90568.1 hypothetical protein LEP1GSC194_3865 [Leptospira alstonii serovar Sichuan str. 79601]EQA82042.1 hypothetical protein LEP1GSC193_3462 [Leptospira alstonii serovar Pingchang str. 80-412]